MTSAPLQLGPKGRTSLPASVRRAAQIPEGAALVARSDGPGRIVLETEDAIRARVWGAAPGGADLVDDVRALRDEDIALADEAAARRSAARSPVGDPGAALLARLGR